MIKQRSGRILNISSIYGVISKEKRSLYTSTKSGLIGFTKSTALDLAKYNILVNSISPGIFQTKLTDRIIGKKGKISIKKTIPLNRIGNVDSVAFLCLFLCSDFNNYITGENIVIDGGHSIQ